MLQICENIRQSRLSKKWTQKETADKLGIKRSTYAEWEKNIVPKMDVLTKLSELFGSDLTKGISYPNEITIEDRATIKMIRQMTAKIYAKVFGVSLEEALNLMAENTTIILEEMKVKR